MKIIEILTDYKYGIFNKHWWRDFYYTQISSRIWHRQSWLIKKLPRTWRDKDHIMEVCILECIRNYIEGEEALGKNMCHFESSQNDSTFPEHQKIFNRELKEVYDLMTIELPRLEKEMEIAWDNVPHRTMEDIINMNTESTKLSYEEMYGDVNRLEKEINDLKTQVMIWAVNNRFSMWT